MTINRRAGKRRLINQPAFPKLATRLDSFKRSEICPKLKKKMMQIVESRMAFAWSFTRPKKIRVTNREMTIEKRKGRRMILIRSTSRTFHVSRARLGYIVKRKRKKGYFFIAVTEEA